MIVSRVATVASRAAFSRPAQLAARRTIVSQKEAKYTATATASGAGRNGKTESGDLSFKLAMPKELGGPGGEGTNPEQLVARQKKVQLPEDVAVQAKVSIGPSEGVDGFALAVAIEVSGLKDHKDLVDAAHEACPYSRAYTKGAKVTAKAV